MRRRHRSDAGAARGQPPVRREPGAGEDQQQAGDGAGAGALAEDRDAERDRDDRVDVGDDERAAGADLADQEAEDDERERGADQAEDDERASASPVGVSRRARERGGDRQQRRAAISSAPPIEARASRSAACA